MSINQHGGADNRALSPTESIGGADEMSLPNPGDPILQELGLSTLQQQLYEYLHARREDPPTMREIRVFDQNLQSDIGEGARAQVDRRLRELYRHFIVRKVRHKGDRGPRYKLERWVRTVPQSPTAKISGGVRARVLAPQRCAMCGRTPLEHNVELAVDHKTPQSWGGTNDIENLQPLCTECNGGKQAWFATYDQHADKIRAAMAHPEPQGRIGELLKAFHGELVPGELLGIVASHKAFQEDWQKRLRELRELGWIIENVKSTFGNRRVISHYRLVHAQPWGQGTIREQLRRTRQHRKEIESRIDDN
ncbi:HNH endonuclease [Promicromonospora sp. Populi]|uniref:HNH endonuclease n=1 Tax=Promicromonospora sp. Populi TaxID=3239420 RepID=UPI0034E26DB0